MFPQTAKHSASIKELAESVSELGGDSTEVGTDDLEEFIGHTPLQVVVGASVGLAVALVSYLVMRYGIGMQFYY